MTLAIRGVRPAPAAAALVVFGVLGVLSGCGGDSSSDAASADEAPPAGPGGQVFAARCASCHGSDLRGTKLGPSFFSIVYEPGHHPDESFRNAIANGSKRHHWNFADMPAVPGLTTDEVGAVIAFVRAQQTEHGFEPYPAS